MKRIVGMQFLEGREGNGHATVWQIQDFPPSVTHQQVDDDASLPIALHQDGIAVGWNLQWESWLYHCLNQKNAIGLNAEFWFYPNCAQNS